MIIEFMFRVQTEININFDKNTWAVVKKKNKGLKPVILTGFIIIVIK